MFLHKTLAMLIHAWVSINYPKNSPSMGKNGDTMPTTSKKVDHAPLEPTEKYDFDGGMGFEERNRFVNEYAKRISESFGIKVAESRILAWAMLDQLQQLVTNTDLLRIPSIGTFKKMDKNNIRFYPDRLIHQKYLVTTDNGKDGDCIKYLRKKKLEEHHKRIP